MQLPQEPCHGGLSPRGRGNQKCTRSHISSHRSIPAWAGEPRVLSYSAKISWVYPRVGGGTSDPDSTASPYGGLSPRGRGNPIKQALKVAVNGSIPAWAGETIGLTLHSHSLIGLSPRGRGNRRDGIPLLWTPRSIPAWAGEPPKRPLHHCQSWVYPRVGGGTLQYFPCQLSPLGLSRAWAGEPSSISPANSALWVYPRVGGGTHYGQRQAIRAMGLSPRGRGNPHPGLRRPGDKRSIPAWAGEPAYSVLRKCVQAVYPRVGGGTVTNARRDTIDGGLSPRGRGNPRMVKPLGRYIRSIPAWAGEPSPPPPFIDRREVYPRVGGGTRALIVK